MVQGGSSNLLFRPRKHTVPLKPTTPAYRGTIQSCERLSSRLSRVGHAPHSDTSSVATMKDGMGVGVAYRSGLGFVGAQHKASVPRATNQRKSCTSRDFSTAIHRDRCFRNSRSTALQGTQIPRSRAWFTRPRDYSGGALAAASSLPERNFPARPQSFRINRYRSHSVSPTAVSPRAFNPILVGQHSRVKTSLSRTPVQLNRITQPQRPAIPTPRMMSPVVAGGVRSGKRNRRHGCTPDAHSQMVNNLSTNDMGQQGHFRVEELRMCL